MLALFAVLGLFSLEALFSSTSLITPISETFLWSMRGIGLFTGLGVGIVSMMISDISWWRKILTVLVTPLLFAFAFDGIGWRMADWAAFGFSRQAFTPAAYPIEGIHRGRKGRSSAIEIDPFKTGENAAIPIPYEQYQALSADSDGLCVVVLQRRSAIGAVEIKTDGEIVLGRPAPVEVGPCDGGSKSGTGSANPWSKT